MENSILSQVEHSGTTVKDSELHIWVKYLFLIFYFGQIEEPISSINNERVDII